MKPAHVTAVTTKGPRPFILKAVSLVSAPLQLPSLFIYCIHSVRHGLLNDLSFILECIHKVKILPCTLQVIDNKLTRTTKTP